MIQDVLELSNEADVVKRDAYRVTLSKHDIVLDVYDKDNLLGFTLSGEIDGKSVYIVRDTDNYPRTNDKYKDLYADAEADALHVAKMFKDDRIQIVAKTADGLFWKKRKMLVIIPDEKGNDITYVSPVVNSVNFLKGQVA